MHTRNISLACLLLGLSAQAEEPVAPATLNPLEQCLLSTLQTAPPETTAAELRGRCQTLVADDATAANGESLILQRREREKVAQTTRSILIPHNRNYILPVTYNRKPNSAPFADASANVLPEDDLDRFEAKFQVSLKFSLADNLFVRDDELFFGFTAKSFWQVYNTDISAPFRETNYEPELFWSTPIKWTPLGSDASLLTFGLSHESNGRGGTLSRSWNRIYASLALEKDNFVFALKPWYRIPESNKTDPMDASGDDNPDITRFLGRFEYTTLYRKGDQEFGLLLRNNLRSDNKGAIQLDWTFPLWRNIRGYAQYFNGYGESLIDYNARTERFGIGFLLTDLL